MGGPRGRISYGVLPPGVDDPGEPVPPLVPGVPVPSSLPGTPPVPSSVPESPPVPCSLSSPPPGYPGAPFEPEPVPGIGVGWLEPPPGEAAGIARVGKRRGAERAELPGAANAAASTREEIFSLFSIVYVLTLMIDLGPRPMPLEARMTQHRRDHQENSKPRAPSMPPLDLYGPARSLFKVLNPITRRLPAWRV
jgi:hypothetical protein